MASNKEPLLLLTSLQVPAGDSGLARLSSASYFMLLRQWKGQWTCYWLSGVTSPGSFSRASLILQPAALGLFIRHSQGSERERESRSLQGLLRLRLGTGALPFLLYLAD